MTGPNQVPIGVVRAALAEVARTARWPDGTLLLDADVTVLDERVAPVLTEQLQAQLARRPAGVARA